MVIGKAQPSLTLLAGNRRLGLWVVLLPLTAIILLFPTHLTPEYHPIQSVYIFDSLLLFAGLYCIWMLLVLLLGSLRGDEEKSSGWESIALASIFGLVFLGFWVIITPHGSYSDGIFNMGHVRYLGEEGSIPVGHQNLVYFDFPGMHLLGSSLSQVCGLGVLEASASLLIFNAVVFAALLYLLFAKSLKSTHLAFLAALLVMLGSVVLVEKMHVFTPGALGFTLLAGSLVVLNKSEGTAFGRTVSDRVLMLILFVGMTIAYFATSFLMILILLSIFAIQRTGNPKKPLVSPTTIALLLVLVFAWEVFWTWHTFQNLAEFLPKLGDDLLAGEFATNTLVVAPANVGARLPLWASTTRLFWWALLGVGTILGIYNLFRARKLSPVEKMETGGLLGVALLALIGLFATEKGVQFHRYLLYAPLFCAPIFLRFLSKSGTWGRRSIGLLTIVLLALALPTFLSSVNTVSTDAIYPYDHASGEFLESSSDDQGRDLVVYRISTLSAAWAHYYIPNTSLQGVPEESDYSEEEVWQRVDELMTDFAEPRSASGEQKIFVIDGKSTVQYQHLLDIPTDAPGWAQLEQRLSSENRVYSNGHVQMYTPRQ